MCALCAQECAVAVRCMYSHHALQDSGSAQVEEPLASGKFSSSQAQFRQLHGNHVRALADLRRHSRASACRFPWQHWRCARTCRTGLLPLRDPADLLPTS